MIFQLLLVQQVCCTFIPLHPELTVPMCFINRDCGVALPAAIQNLLCKALYTERAQSILIMN